MSRRRRRQRAALPEGLVDPKELGLKAHEVNPDMTNPDQFSYDGVLPSIDASDNDDIHGDVDNIKDAPITAYNDPEKRFFPKDPSPVIPPSLLTPQVILKDERYHLTLYVSKVTTGVAKESSGRRPVIEFDVSLAMVKYYMTPASLGARMPAIAYTPLSDVFKLDIPVSLLPEQYAKNPDSLSPALASELLIKIFGQNPWEVVRKPPAPDKMLLPDALLKILEGGPYA